MQITDRLLSNSGPMRGQVLEGGAVGQETAHEQRKPFVTIIIPVFNDPQRLRMCLEALESQTYPSDCYEVIVADNGSDQPIDDLVSQFRHARFTLESHPGSYAARNKGISLAQGDVIAFTDADCVPDPDWIGAGVEALERVRYEGVIAGRVKVLFKDSARPTVTEWYDNNSAFPQQTFVEAQHFGVTANLFTSQTVIQNVGAFDGTLKSSGDREWGQRAFLQGYPVIYADDVVVAHPARSTLGELRSRARRITGGIHDTNQRRRFPGLLLIGNLLWDIAALMFLPLQISMDKRLSGFRQRSGVLFIAAMLRLVLMSERIYLFLGKSSQRK